MDTVAEGTQAYRRALSKGQFLKAGPPVLLEASRSDEALLPTVARPKRPQWQTEAVAPPDATDAHREQRVDQMMALQDYVDDGSRIYPLVKGGANSSPDICVGRAKRNDIAIEDGTISSLHAAVSDDGERLRLEDQHSSNGTFVNRVRLAPGASVVLRSGDCVRMGTRVFYYLSGSRLQLFLELRAGQGR